MPILGAILRPGRGAPAFQLVLIHAGQRFPTLTLANKTQCSTDRSGSWSIEPAGPFTAEEWPDRTPSWLAVSEYALICHGQVDSTYRIYGLKLKPNTMPPRCKELEVNVTLTGTAYLAFGAAGGREYLEILKRTPNRVGNTEGWLSAGDLYNRIPTAPVQAPQPLQLPQQTTNISISVNGIQLTETQLVERTMHTHTETQRLQHLTNLYSSAQAAQERAQVLMEQTRTSYLAVPIAQSILPLRSHVARILVQDARMKGEECPITFDALREISQFAVPICGHVCSESATQLARCPVCREPTSWTRVDIPA